MTPTTVCARTRAKAACPDCRTELRPIKLIDHSIEPDRELEYAGADAPLGFFLGRFRVAGKVKAKMCPSCHRIVLHGEPTGSDTH